MATIKDYDNEQPTTNVIQNKPKQTQFSNRKTEDRRQKTEDRRQKTEDRRQKAEYGPPGYGPSWLGLAETGGLRPDECRDESGLAMTARNVKYRIMKEN